MGTERRTAASPPFKQLRLWEASKIKHSELSGLLLFNQQEPCCEAPLSQMSAPSFRLFSLLSNARPNGMLVQNAALTK